MTIDKFGRDRATIKRIFGVNEFYHDVENKRLSNVATPEDDGDAITKDYLESQLESYATKNDIDEIKAQTLLTITAKDDYYDFGNKRLRGVSNPKDDSDAINQSHLNGQLSEIRGSCLAKRKRIDSPEYVFNADDLRIIKVGEPRWTTDAVTKMYVDKKYDSITKTLNQVTDALKRQLELAENSTAAGRALVEGLYKHFKIDKQLYALPRANFN